MVPIYEEGGGIHIGTGSENNFWSREKGEGGKGGNKGAKALWLFIQIQFLYTRGGEGLKAIRLSIYVPILRR